MTLQNWANNGWLRTHKTSKQEIKQLLEIVERDLQVGVYRKVNHLLAIVASEHKEALAAPSTSNRSTKALQSFRIVECIIGTRLRACSALSGAIAAWT